MAAKEGKRPETKEKKTANHKYNDKQGMHGTIILQAMVDN